MLCIYMWYVRARTLFLVVVLLRPLFAVFYMMFPSSAGVWSVERMLQGVYLWSRFIDMAVLSCVQVAVPK